MAVTIKGLQGTVSDADMATQLGGHHVASVRSVNDLAVTAVASARTVSVAAGVGDSAFMKVVNDAALQLTLAPPASGGKWYAITIDRQWSPTNSATFRADDLNVSDSNGTVPTVLPTAVYTALNTLPNQPGTSGSAAGQRQVLAVVYVRAADTTLTIFDLRVTRTGTGVLSVANLFALVALSALVLDGSIIEVRPLALNGTLTLRQSLWIRVGGIFEPVAGSQFLLRGDSSQADLVTAGALLLTLQQSTNGVLAWPVGQVMAGQTLTSTLPNAVVWGGDATWRAVNLYSDVSYSQGWQQWDNAGWRSILKRENNTVTAILNFANTNTYGGSGPQSSVYPLGALPADFRPARIVVAQISIYINGSGWVGAWGQLQIGTDGSVGINYLSRQIPAVSLHCVVAAWPCA